jgi:hypothetical protein
MKISLYQHIFEFVILLFMFFGIPEKPKIEKGHK